MSRAGINIDSVYVTTHGHHRSRRRRPGGGDQVAAGMAVMAFE
jgi:hypothetical protein